VVAWVTFPAGRLRFVRGEPACFASSEPVLRTFCGACGTPLTYQHRDEPQWIDVTTCTLDEPDAFPPTHRSWVSHDLEWMKSAAALPRFPGSRYEQGSG